MRKEEEEEGVQYKEDVRITEEALIGCLDSSEEKVINRRIQFVRTTGFQKFHGQRTMLTAPGSPLSNQIIRSTSDIECMLSLFVQSACYLFLVNARFFSNFVFGP